MPKNLSEFPLSQLYLTPRTIKHARAAGVLAFWADVNQMQGILDRIHQGLPEVEPPGEAEDLAVVLRWGGRFGWSTDVRYTDARDQQLYLPASAYNFSQEQLYGATKTEINAAGRPVVEVDTRRWDKPLFGQRFADGVLHCDNYTTDAISAAAPATTRSSIITEMYKRHLAYECQMSYPDPISTVIPPEFTDA